MDSDLKNGVSRGSGSTWQRLSSKIWRPKSPGSASGAVQSRRAGSDAVPAGNGSGTLTTLITPKNPDSVVEEDGNQGAKNELSGRESSINDELASAYEIAWLSFDENQQNELSDRETIALLFEKLNATDKQHRQNSLLRKGLSAVKPFLDVVSVIIDFVSPVASLQPGAATGLGVAKGALSIVIAICGAAADLSDKIRSFLDIIPVIDRCSEIVTAQGDLPDMHKALVNVYTDLLNFYLKTIRFFKGSKFVIKVAINKLKPALPGIIDSFDSHVATLTQIIQAETFATVVESRNEHIDTFIRDTLRSNKDDEKVSHNLLKRRADNACNWIESNDAFVYWAVSERDSKMLALSGALGSGKTMTTAYVADYLSKSKRRPVCAYYSMDDPANKDLASTYRSLIWQLLQQQPNLKPQFSEWYKTTSRNERCGDPTTSERELEKFLHKAISASKNWVFVIVDGLDEYNTAPRRELLELFRQEFDSKGRLKVFISCRSGPLADKLARGNALVQMHTSKDQDRIITEYQFAQEEISADIREQVIHEVTEKANGSAIWIKMALRFIATSRIKNERGLKKILAQLSSSTDMADLYSKLFQKCCQGNPITGRNLRICLETIAIARRHLTFQELCWAIFVDREDEPLTTISELQDVAESVELRDILAPFVTFVQRNSDDRNLDQVQLVHGSLSELIIHAPPEKWKDTQALEELNSKEVAAKKKRNAQLNADLMRRCIKYLLLKECGERRILASFDDAIAMSTLPTTSNIFGDSPLELSARTSLDETDSLHKAPELMPDFDPTAQGLGCFYSYAASFWTSHFSEVSEQLRPELDDLITLCQPKSIRLNSWVDQWERPNCTYRQERYFPTDVADLDPLVVAAIFGPTASFTDMFKLDRSTPRFLPWSNWRVVKDLVRRDQTTSLKALVKSSAVGSGVTCVTLLFTIGNALSGRSLQDENRQAWEAFLDFLIQTLRPELLEDGSGNDVLCQAARDGCLLLVERLFAAAETDDELRSIMLSKDRAMGKAWLEWNTASSELVNHQSVGEAAYYGHVEVVRFLCKQRGIQSHIRFISSLGRTAFHLAARLHLPEIFTILCQRWPEGLNMPDKNQEIPLVELAFNGTRFNSDVIESFRVMLNTGMLDVNGLDNTLDEFYLPLSTAVRKGNVELCKVFVVEGSADPYTVLEIDNSGNPSLKVNVSTFDPSNPDKDKQGKKDHEEMLQAICNLCPVYLDNRFRQSLA